MPSSKASIYLFVKKVKSVLGLVLPLTLALFLLIEPAGAYDYIKMGAEAATGLCLAEAQSDIETVLSQRNILIEGASDLEKRAVHRVLSTIERIGDGRFGFHQGVHFVFTRNSGLSDYDGRRINIRRNQGNAAGFRALASHLPTENLRAAGGTNNHALIAHELGHYIGHKVFRGGSLYRHFETKVSKCRISGYAEKDRADRHEEFAEAFAAYVTAPSYFLYDKACADSFMFFAELFGEILPRPTCDYRVASVGRERLILSFVP